MTVADDIDTTERIVSALAPDNDHLVEDNILRDVLEFAANGRATPEFESAGEEPIQPCARVLPADPDADARYPHERPAPSGLCCERCSRSYAGGFQPDGDFDEVTDGRDGSRHTLWIAAGTAVVEIVVCRACRTYLDRDFAPVTWR